MLSNRRAAPAGKKYSCLAVFAIDEVRLRSAPATGVHELSYGRMPRFGEQAGDEPFAQAEAMCTRKIVEADDAGHRVAHGLRCAA